MDDFETTIQLLANECEKELDKLEGRKAAVDEQVASVKRDLDGFRAVIVRYRAHLGIEANESIEVDEELRQRFQGLSNRDVLVEIAKDNAGSLVGKEAYATMIKAGMFKDERGASNAFYRAMSRNPDVFEKVRRGVYGLIDRSAEEWASTQPPPPQPLVQRTA